MFPQARQMDPASLLISVCAMMLCLRCANSDETCPCHRIPPLPRTNPPPDGCYKSTFRYSCVDGFVRKVGTSNLIKCKQKDGSPQWSNPSLVCIPDPLRPTTKPPPTTTTTGDIFQEFNATSTFTASASTGRHQTQSGGTSAPVTPGATSTELSSLDERSHYSQDLVTETETMAWRTQRLTTAKHSKNTTDNSTNVRHINNILDKPTTAGVTVFGLLLICAAAGLIFMFYRRKIGNNHRQGTEEEKMSMNELPSAVVLQNLCHHGEQI
ncbi:interleukin-15 receptor subunit alpha isoform X2 [Echeneis naucrates]|uniref:interleukin-15 receptor subunit alpha isoform X2 n=1 Tax=Echeneis naucrates TaxID=173247 RepID=UPI0011143C89|nr:interleukin-15 receptor subunit alpha isoform X2 [Echeneis naucrates]